jgi:hypothetical protein
MWEYRAQVLWVHDGDTLGVDLDLGLHTHLHTTLRLHGINAPELGKAKDPNPAGEASTRALMALLGGRELFRPNRTPGTFGNLGNYLPMPDAPPIRLVVQTILTKEFEAYGRVLGKARLVDSDAEIGASLLASGWADPLIL